MHMNYYSTKPLHQDSLAPPPDHMQMIRKAGYDEEFEGTLSRIEDDAGCAQWMSGGEPTSTAAAAQDKPDDDRHNANTTVFGAKARHERMNGSFRATKDDGENAAEHPEQDVEGHGGEDAGEEAEHEKAADNAGTGSNGSRKHGRKAKLECPVHDCKNPIRRPNPRRTDVVTHLRDVHGLQGVPSKHGGNVSKHKIAQNQVIYPWLLRSGTNEHGAIFAEGVTGAAASGLVGYDDEMDGDEQEGAGFEEDDNDDQEEGALGGGDVDQEEVDEDEVVQQPPAKRWKGWKMSADAGAESVGEGVAKVSGKNVLQGKRSRPATKRYGDL
ncbi:hypothetical protein LTR65_003004 [Meristemomyces frigidus]